MENKVRRDDIILLGEKMIMIIFLMISCTSVHIAYNASGRSESIDTDGKTKILAYAQNRDHETKNSRTFTFENSTKSLEQEILYNLGEFILELKKLTDDDKKNLSISSTDTVWQNVLSGKVLHFAKSISKIMVLDDNVQLFGSGSKVSYSLANYTPSGDATASTFKNEANEGIFSVNMSAVSLKETKPVAAETVVATPGWVKVDIKTLAHNNPRGDSIKAGNLIARFFVKTNLNETDLATLLAKGDLSLLEPRAIISFVDEKSRGKDNTEDNVVAEEHNRLVYTYTTAGNVDTLADVKIVWKKGDSVITFTDSTGTVIPDQKDPYTFPLPEYKKSATDLGLSNVTGKEFDLARSFITFISLAKYLK